MIHSRILGVGHHVPERVVTNADLVDVLDTTDEWIVQRTGIRERRFVTQDGGRAPRDRRLGEDRDHHRPLRQHDRRVAPGGFTWGAALARM